MASKIMRCKSSFAFDDKGLPRVVNVGELVSTDDSAFKANREVFDEVETHVEQQRKALARATGRGDESPVEQATAAPGEKRTTVRPVSTPAVSKPTASAGGAANDATVKANDPKSK